MSREDDRILKIVIIVALLFLSAVSFSRESSPIGKGDKIPTWEESSPVPNRVFSPWEQEQGPWNKFKKLELFSQSKKNWLNLKKAFSGDPLAFIDDPQVRADVDFALYKCADAETERKKWALAAYFSQMRKEEIAFCHANLDQLIKKFNGGKEQSVDQAYRAVARSLGISVPTEGEIFLARVFRCALACFFVLFLLLMLFFLIKFVDWRRLVSFYSKKMTGRQQIALCLSCSAIVLLLLGIRVGFDAEFYSLLRWAVCLAFLGKVIEDFPSLFKFVLISGAVLFNPIAPVRLEDRDVWCLLDFLALIVVLISEILVFLKVRKKWLCEKEGKKDITPPISEQSSLDRTDP